MEKRFKLSKLNDHMNKKAIKSTIKEYLMQQDEIIFAYLYGSFVGRERFRDIDVAVFSGESLPLIRLGTMQTDLVKHTDLEVDLTGLNNLPSKHPAFAYDIVTKGELLFNKEPHKHTEYKKSVFLYYFDTARLRDRIDKTFKDRLDSDNFGRRNYA